MLMPPMDRSKPGSRLMAAVSRLVAGRGLSILMYHAVVEGRPPLDDWCFVPVDAFEAQMRWLAGAPVDVRPLDEAVADLLAGRLSRPTVALTFDDGYRNNVSVALPILERYRLPATVFLATDFIGSRRALWPSRLMAALMATENDALDWDRARYDLTGEAGRAAASRALQAWIKAHCPDDPAGGVAEIETLLGRPVDPEMPAGSPFRMMDRDDVDTAQRSGLISLAAHSRSHPILSALDDRRLEAEIDGSIRAVESLTGAPCRMFAYPNGRPEDFDARAVALLKARGVAVAVTTVEGPNRRGADPLRLARWGIGRGMRDARYRATVLNLHPATFRARRRSAADTPARDG
jgi:peptidoglycan/xylan/chitin deacetylase (PgdA/CDA1 family)